MFSSLFCLISILDPTKSLNTYIIPRLFALRKTEPQNDIHLLHQFSYTSQKQPGPPLKKSQKTQQKFPVFFCWSFLHLSSPLVCCQSRLLHLPLSTKRQTETSIWMILSASDPAFHRRSPGGVFRDVMVSDGFRVTHGNTDSFMHYVHHSKISLSLFHCSSFF